MISKGFVRGGDEFTGRFRVHYLENERWRWAHGIAGIRHEPRIMTTSHFDTRLCKSRLSSCMVFIHEVEFDNVANSCLDGIWDVHNTGAASHSDLEQTVV